MGDVNPSSDSLNVPHAVDALQVAAQTYPWLYMNSTLDACFTKAEQSAKVRFTKTLPSSNPHAYYRELDILENRVSQDEADVADEKALYEIQRLIKFCHELTSSTVSSPSSLWPN